MSRALVWFRRDLRLDDHPALQAALPAGRPDAALPDPWADDDLLARLAPDYPRRPIVDVKASRAEALAAYSGPKSLPPE